MSHWRVTWLISLLFIRVSVCLMCPLMIWKYHAEQLAGLELRKVSHALPISCIALIEMVRSAIDRAGYFIEENSSGSSSNLFTRMGRTPGTSTRDSTNGSGTSTGCITGFQT